MKPLTLFTADGRLVTELPLEAEPVVAMMIANGGPPPELLAWGTRFFIHQGNAEYRETMCTVVGLRYGPS